MRRVSLVVLLATALTAFADDKKAALPSGLSAEEVSDGWISLFDGETLFGWKTEGSATVADGALVLTDAKEATAMPTTDFGDFDLAFQYRYEGKGTPKFVYRRGGGGIGNNMVTRNPAGTWVDAAIRREGNKVQMSFVWPNGRADSSSEVSGPPAGASWHFSALEGGKLFLRSIRLKPAGLKPIFNGKDLSGWKEIPGHKSKFSVTDKGELNIKDGNGDIQTEGQYDDFVLQLDVFSNGDHLNSGVFFRCIPDSFWSGYEAQIRNEWISDVKLKDGSTVSGSYTDKGDKVTVQACTKAGDNNWRPAKDIKTINKSDVEQVIHHRDQVVDIGTGGIYNRQPARKVVSNDREWYTMTVVAHGTHMATWVNGYQVADFVDVAPIGDNARKGAKVSKGPLSLQGHDPTTDLNFKNIRIAELPKAEGNR
jgi:hypothetical protein